MEEEQVDEDYENFEVGFEIESSTTEQQNNKFACLSPQEIVSQQEKEIKSVSDLFSISPSIAATLLRHFQWKKEKLIAKFLDNPDQIYKEAGITFDSSNVATTTNNDNNNNYNNNNNNKDENEMCSICGDEMTKMSSSSMICGHLFCNDCLGQYITMKIKEGITNITCPFIKCNVIMDDLFCKKLVDNETYKRYLRFISKSFVEDSGGSIKWCPQANCGNAITVDMISGTIVKCTCGFRFCFSCHKEAHAPATCEQVKLWDKKCKDDSETEHWKYANTKECTKCETPVEKNGGCNHMTCRQCKYEWCWVCQRPWKGHNDYYNCNKFVTNNNNKEKLKIATWTTMLFKNATSKKDKIKEKEQEREKNRIQLERYLHYYERYVNHSHSSDLEKQIRTRAISKMNELQKLASTTSEVQYIIDGTEVLFECRNVLKYTYVSGYYLPESGPEKELFEYLQEDLEKTTELLSEILETSESTVDFRLKALNLIELSKTRKKNLLQGVEEGLTDKK